MIWSTSAGSYFQCVAASDNNSVNGRWSHLEPLFTDDGGHGMLFNGLDGKLRLTLHCPNKTLSERPVFFDIKEENDTLVIEK